MKPSPARPRTKSARVAGSGTVVVVTLCWAPVGWVSMTLLSGEKSASWLVPLRLLLTSSISGVRGGGMWPHGVSLDVVCGRFL
jgi:hypothetical protein